MKFLDIQATIECEFTLKRVSDMIITSGIPIHNSESPDTAGRKTTRTQATEKYHAFHVNTTKIGDG